MFVAHPEIMYKERPHADALCGIRCLKNGVDIPAARRREGRGEGEGEGEGQGDREREAERARLFLQATVGGACPRGSDGPALVEQELAFKHGRQRSQVQSIEMDQLRHVRIVVGGCLTLLVRCQCNPEVLELHQCWHLQTSPRRPSLVVWSGNLPARMQNPY